MAGNKNEWHEVPLASEGWHEVPLQTPPQTEESLGQKVGHYTASALPALGLISGGMAGSALGLGGAVGGAALGNMAGERVKQSLEEYLSNKPVPQQGGNEQAIEALKNAGAGAAGELVGQGIGKAVGAGIRSPVGQYIADRLGAAGKYAAQKIGYGGLKIPEETVGRYIENPEAIKNALPKEDIAQKLADTFGDLRAETGPATEQALSTLSKTNQTQQGLEAEALINKLKSFNDPQAQKLATELEAKYIQNFGGREPGLPTTITRKMEFAKPQQMTTPFGEGLSSVESNNGLAPSPNQNIYTTPEAIPESPQKILTERRLEASPQELPPEMKYLTEREGHDVKRTFQNLTDYKNPLPGYEQSRARGAAGELNNILKTGNPDYAAAMEPLAENIRAKQGLANKFGIQPDYSGANESGFTYGDRTIPAINSLSRANTVERGRILDAVKNQGHGDFAGQIQNTLDKSAFGADATRGSRLTNLGAIAGSGVGGSVAGVPGAAVGGALGGIAGSAADRYGGQMLMGGIDGAKWAAKLFGEKAPYAANQMTKIMGSPYARQLENAYQNGGHDAVNTTSYILQQTDPNYQKLLSNDGDRQ